MSTSPTLSNGTLYLLPQKGLQNGGFTHELETCRTFNLIYCIEIE